MCTLAIHSADQYGNGHVERVHRTPCEHDRRATILTVTEQGLAHLEEACMIVEKQQERLFAPLSPAQREELTRSLALIAEATKGHA